MVDITTRGAWLVTGSAGPGGIALETADGDELVFDLKDSKWYVGLAYGQGAGTDWVGPLDCLEDALSLLGRP